MLLILVKDPNSNYVVMLHNSGQVNSLSVAQILTLNCK